MSDVDEWSVEAVRAEAAREAWLRSRDGGFGCSDLGALWIILGWVGKDQCDWHEVDAVDGKGKPVKRWASDLYKTCPKTGQRDYATPRYLWDSALPMKKTGLPKLIAQKAGLAKAGKQSDAQAEGLHKERDLFSQSRLGQFDVDARYAPDVDPEDPEIRRMWGDRFVGQKPMMIRDAVEPRLLSTVEAFEYTPKGLIAWEMKCDRLGLRTEPPWAHRLQSLGQAVVMGADAFGLQYGPGWAMTDLPAFPDLGDPIQWGPWVVKDSDRALIRKAVAEGWKLVEAARARAK